MLEKPLFDYMSCSYKFETLGNGNSYDSNAQPEMSAHEEEVTGEVEANATEGNEENSENFSTELVDERIRASLEPLHAQMSPIIEIILLGSKSTKMRNRIKEMKNRLRKSQVSIPAVNQPMEYVNTCKHELFPSFLCFLFNISLMYSTYISCNF